MENWQTWNTDYLETVDSDVISQYGSHEQDIQGRLGTQNVRQIP